jgi:dihydroceramidase
MTTYSPVWGPISSNVDWCERNYVVSPYFAEFWNSVSSLPMVVLGFFGMMHSYYNLNQLGIRFPVAYFFLMLVGFGSFLFHMTLLYSCQLLDELPMILGTLVFIYIMLDFHAPGESVLASSSYINTVNISKDSKNKLLLGALLTYGFLTCLVMAMFTHSPVPMNLSYVFMVAFLIIRASSIFYYTPSNVIKTLYILAFITYMSGATFWIIEKNFCSLFSPVTEYFHVIWHLLAGHGTYTFITWTQIVHAYLLGLTPKVQYAYGIFPYISAINSKAQ